VNNNKILVYLGVLLASIAIAYFAIRGQLSHQVVGTLIFLLVFIPTLFKPEIGLIIIVISMLFSPDVILGRTAARQITVRIEDIFLLVVILASLVRTTFTKGLVGIFRSRITAPAFLYIAACILSTVFFQVFSSEVDLGHAGLIILKYLQYFILFFVVKDNLKGYKQAKRLIIGLFIVALAVSLYSNRVIEQNIASGVGTFRVTPPVETSGGGESSTLGAYLLLMMGLAAGLMLYSANAKTRILLAILNLLMFRAFLYTLSRGSYLGFIPMLLTLLFFARKKIVFFVISVLLFMVFAFFVPEMIRDRISSTITQKHDAQVAYWEWDESAQARLTTWDKVLSQGFPSSPLFGHGIGGVFIDSQFFSILNDTGLLGLFLFCWLLFRIFKNTMTVLAIDAVRQDRFSMGLGVGFLAGFVGLIFASLTMNVFIIIRVMEPFWFTAAIIFSLPKLVPAKEEEAIAL